MFGGIDILVNNASAISLTGTQATPMKKYDLMNGVNTRGTYLWYAKWFLVFLVDLVLRIDQISKMFVTIFVHYPLTFEFHIFCNNS